MTTNPAEWLYYGIIGFVGLLVAQTLIPSEWVFRLVIVAVIAAVVVGGVLVVQYVGLPVQEH